MRAGEFTGRVGVTYVGLKVDMLVDALPSIMPISSRDPPALLRRRALSFTFGEAKAFALVSQAVKFAIAARQGVCSAWGLRRFARAGFGD